MSFLKGIAVGNLGSDIEIKYSAQGNAYCNFSIATSEGVKNKEGNFENLTTWIKCLVFGKLAENCGKNLSKGSKVYIEGRLREEKWTDRDGNEKSSLLMNVSDVQFLTPSNTNNNSNNSNNTNKTSIKEMVLSKNKKSHTDEDIPF